MSDPLYVTHLAGTKYVATLPPELGKAVKLYIENGLIHCLTESGIIFVCPNRREKAIQ